MSNRVGGWRGAGALRALVLAAACAALCHAETARADMPELAGTSKRAGRESWVAPAGYAGGTPGCAAPGCTAPYGMEGSMAAETPAAGMDSGTGAGAPGAAPDFGSLSSTSGFTAGSEASQAGLGMIGDQIPGGGVSVEFISVVPSQTAGSGRLSLPIAGGDRIPKIMENNHTLPVTRAFFNFHHFSNSLIPGNSSTASPDSMSLDRYLFGLELATPGNLMSIETRIPFAYGLDDHQILAPVNNAATEFGNMLFIGKLLLWGSDWATVATGLGVVAPTADDGLISNAAGSPTLLVKNEGWHMQPFVGFQVTPNDRLWMTFFTSFDFDTTGMPVDFIAANGAGRDGVLQDQSLMFLDAAAGWWIYRDPSRVMAGVAPIIELHYTHTMQDSDFVAVGTSSVRNFFNRQDALNMTGGLRMQFGARSYLTVAGIAPLRAQPQDKLFDAELGVQFNVVR